MTSPDTQHSNRLVHEKSPYLLQHAHNPVDWYPWGEEGFAKARGEDKPIFLSIGYSTCHWCHVMERESFENPLVAELLNRDFVPVKVDREERPDVDRVYMTAMQAMGTGGGWPLNVFLTPELEPFFGGTYFPPSATQGRMGMLQILPRVSEAWRQQREQIRATGNQVIEALTAYATTEPGAPERDALIEDCYRALAASHDEEHGGFGRAPKFPTIPNLVFLFRWWASDRGTHAHALAMALAQLDAMRRGGIHDHLGGGFHRYSTDARWLVPHFEKMLYDQAQIAWAFLEGWQATGRAEYADAALALFAYVARDLTSPAGAFDSAEDADSEGEEGKFYVWTPAETRVVLGDEEAAIFDHHYGVSADGNFENGWSILNETHTVEDTAHALKLDSGSVRERLARARERLLAARSRRVRPHRDDKVITAWNGLMISAFARGARALERPALAANATRAAEFVWRTLYDERSGDLQRRFRDGQAGMPGQLDDYAYLAAGFLDLYGATFDPMWLERAVALTDAQIERFWDAADGGFFDTPAGDASVRVRMKDEFDGAEMAGNSIAAHNLLALGTLLDRADWRALAEATLDFYARRLARHPIAMPQMMAAMERARMKPRHVVIAGDPAAPDTRAMIAEFDRRFLPHDLLLVVDGGSRQARLAKLAPFVGPLAKREGRATAYVCVDYTCRLPTTDPAAFAAQLDAAADTKPEPSPS